MTTITGKTKAWAAHYSAFRPQDAANPTPTVINHLQYTNIDMTDQGWTDVGEATVTVDFVSHNDLIKNKVEALRAEAANIRAEATAKCTRIEDQINQLLCLEFTPASEVDNG